MNDNSRGEQVFCVAFTAQVRRVSANILNRSSVRFVKASELFGNLSVEASFLRTTQSQRERAHTHTQTREAASIKAASERTVYGRTGRAYRQVYGILEHFIHESVHCA